ncbi:MAG: hypothetical protein ACKOPI_03940 [bacterium]
MNVRSGKRILPVVAIFAVAFVLIGCGAGDDQEAASCGNEEIAALSPSGEGFNTFTMILRLNQTVDLEEFARPGLRSLIRDRDVFVINTTYSGMDSSEARSLLSKVTRDFPCNRVVSLNSLGQDSDKPGYEYALVGEPGLDAVMVDWEPDTVALLGKNAWHESVSANVAEARGQLESIVSRLPDDSTTRVGLVTQYEQGWDYSTLASELERVNRTISRDFLGYQVVQTQYSCGAGNSKGMSDVVADLRESYREALSDEKALSREDFLDRLGFEVSFSTTPEAGASEVVEEDSPTDAAQCTQDILTAGGSAVLYWATPSAIEAMLSTPVGKSLRNAAS